MIVPTIHLNGTSKERLVEAICEACGKINAAYEAVKETAPNGRDYYPQGADAFNKAIEEHLDRLRRLDSVLIDLEQLAMAIQET